MKQYDKKEVDLCMEQLGYSKDGVIYTKKFNNWWRRIWIQAGVSSLSGSFTVNYDLVHDGIIQFLRPEIPKGKGNSVLTIRIGELLGVGDKWYSSITPLCVQKTTKDLISDIVISNKEFDKIQSEEVIAKYLWDMNSKVLAIFVMALYLDPLRIKEIVDTVDINGTVKNMLLKFAEKKFA